MVIHVPLKAKHLTVSVIVDDKDAPLLEGRSVRIVQAKTGKYYARVWREGRAIGLQRIILNAPAGLMVDHEDGNPLNNARSNLRLASRSQNNANTQKYHSNKSGYKGVYWDKSTDRWKAQITHGGVVYNLGRGHDPEKLAVLYDRAALRLHGAFARLNFPA